MKYKLESALAHDHIKNKYFLILYMRKYRLCNVSETLYDMCIG